MEKGQVIQESWGCVEQWLGALIAWLGLFQLCHLLTRGGIVGDLLVFLIASDFLP
jgi:hypothetical protein